MSGFDIAWWMLYCGIGIGLLAFGVKGPVVTAWEYVQCAVIVMLWPMLLVAALTWAMFSERKT